MISDDGKIFRSPLFANKYMAESVFCKHFLSSKYCPLGKKVARLIPELRCNDKFHLIYDDNDNITKLIVEKSGKAYEDYTIYLNNDMSYSADACLTPSMHPRKEK